MEEFIGYSEIFNSLENAEEDKEHFGCPCYYCGKALGHGEWGGILHHLSYQPEKIARVCRRCHFLIHRKELQAKAKFASPPGVLWRNLETGEYEE